MEPGFLRGIWDAVSSEQAQNMAQVVMASAVLLAYLDYIRGRKRDRVEASEKRKAEEEALKIKKEEIDAALVEQYIAVLDDFIEHPELDTHDNPLESMQAQRQRRIYEKLILLFATAFRRLHEEQDPGLQEQWYSWQDDIDDWLVLPNFRDALDELLTGETQAFTDYMKKKKEEIPQHASVRPRKRNRSVVGEETGPTTSLTMH